MEILKVVEGKHENVRFRYEKGKLICFDREFDKQDIKILVDIVNLLELQGYSLKFPIKTTKTMANGMWGLYEKEEKEYEEDQDND